MIDYYDLEKLTLEELLGLALRDTNSVKELASKYVTPRSLCHASLKDLEDISGIGKKKALQILAVLELSRRIVSSPPNSNPIISAPAEVVDVVKDHMKLLDREHFIVFNLNIKNRIISTDTVAIGSLNSAIVHPREIFKQAIKLGAASIIACHNHPSGFSEPSLEDIEITKRIANAGEIVGIQLLDHLVIGDGSYVSMREKGIIQGE